MSKSCKPLHPGLFLLGAATALLVFAAPQTCAAALRQGLALCGGPLLVSLFPFLVVSALIMRSGAGEVLGVLLWPVVRASVCAAAARAVCCSSALWAALPLPPLLLPRQSAAGS